VHAALRYECMRPDATSACGLKLLVHAALSYVSVFLNPLADLSQQICHRDIKAANILYSNEGVVKLADFGTSKKIADVANMSVRFPLLLRLLLEP
jgi:serine/threonine protein kinase